MITNRNSKMIAAAALLGGLLLGAATGCEKGSPPQANVEVPRNVRVLTLAGETVNEYFEISGPVSPVRGTDLSAEESGPVVAIPVVKGATVQAGQIGFLTQQIDRYGLLHVSQSSVPRAGAQQQVAALVLHRIAAVASVTTRCCYPADRGA